MDDDLRAGRLVDAGRVTAQDHRQLLGLDPDAPQRPQVVVVEAPGLHRNTGPSLRRFGVRALTDHEALQRLVGVDRLGVDGSHGADPSQTVRPSGALASAALMAATRSRADAAVSSMAMRAEGPRSGAARSTLSVCSAIACTGWSKYTVASVTRSHEPPGPLALPVTGVWTVA